MFFNVSGKGINNPLFYLLTILGVALGYFIFQLPLTYSLINAVENDPALTMDALSEFEKNPDFSVFGIDKAFGLSLMILIFAGVWLALWLGTKFLHQRPFKTLITFESSINWSKIGFGFFVFLLLAGCSELIYFFIDSDRYIYTFNLDQFFPLLLVGIFLLPIQTTAEELLFRGYLLQGITYILNSPWLGILLSSLLFGSIHFWNPEIDQFGFPPMATYYIGAGLLLALLTVFDDSNELSIGVHAAVNFYGAVITSYNGGVFQTDSIFKTQTTEPWIATGIFIITFIAFMYICSKKYKWPPINNLISRLDFKYNEQA